MSDWDRRCRMCGALDPLDHGADASKRVTAERLRRLRDESTPDGRRIWANVDKAVKRAPRWWKERG